MLAACAADSNGKIGLAFLPIVWDKKKKHFRKITPREAANLQSFNKDYKFTGTQKQMYTQLGNSVNVKILKVLGENLFNLRKKELVDFNYE